MAARTLAQALSLWLIARVLGPNGYGAITAVVSIAGAFGYLLAFGVPLSMVNAVARGDRTLPTAWRETVAASLASIPLLVLSYAGVALLILPKAVPLFVAACFALAEIVVLPMCQACVYACIAADRRRDAARLTLMPAFVRLLFAAVLWPSVQWLDPARVLLVWAAMYLLSSSLALALAARHIRPWTAGSWPPAWHGLRPAVREGFPFAVAGLAQKLAADADKALLAGLGSLHAAGIYGLAYRILEMAQTPMHALALSTLTHFVRHRQRGPRAAVRELLHILPIPMVYAVLVAPTLFGAAWLIPAVFGEAFANASKSIQHMALLPLLMAPRIQIQAVLNSAGMQARVAASQFLGAGLGIAINIFLIPRWGIDGAIAAAYAVETFLLLIQSLVLRAACMRQPAIGH